jgi:hypothetical protein
MGAAASPSTESLGRNQVEEWSTAGREAPAGPRWVRRGRRGPGSGTRNRGRAGRGPARATGVELAGVGHGATRATPAGAERCGPG